VTETKKETMFKNTKRKKEKHTYFVATYSGIERVVQQPKNKGHSFTYWLRIV